MSAGGGLDARACRRSERLRQRKSDDSNRGHAVMCRRSGPVANPSTVGDPGARAPRLLPWSIDVLNHQRTIGLSREPNGSSLWGRCPEWFGVNWASRWPARLFWPSRWRSIGRRPAAW